MRSLLTQLSRSLCVAGLAISAAANADGGDGRSASLAAEALQLDQTARALETAAASNSVDFYIGDRANNLLLLNVRAQLDDGSLRQYDYSDAEAKALAQGGLQHWSSLPATAGSHRLRLEFSGRSANALPGDPRIRGRFDQTFEVAAGGHAIAAELFMQGYVNPSPVLKLNNLNAAPAGSVTLANDDAKRNGAFIIGSEEDPHVRYARFLEAEHRPFNAASELLYLQAHSGAALPNTFAMRLSSILGEELGQQAQAESLSRSLSSADAALLKQNEDAIGGDFAALPAAGAAEATPDMSRIAQGTPTNSGGWALRDQANLLLGYEELNKGQASAAIDSFGRVRAQGPFSARGLLGFGWAYLQSSSEPSSKDAGTNAGGNSATHSGSADPRPQFIADIERRQRRSGKGVHATPPTSTQLQGLQGALVPWTELIGRNPMDPAVQEGLLAIAYALDHTGAFDDALRFYQRSVKLQETTLSRLESARAQVSDGRMLAAIVRGAGNSDDSGWHWQLPDVPVDAHWWLTLNDDPRAPDNFYFEQLLAEPNFNAALAQYRLLQSMIAAGDAHLQWLAQNNADAGGLQSQLQSLKARLTDASAAAAEQLKTVALADLLQQKKQAEAYLVEGRFALARSNDWVPPPPEVAKK